MVLIVRELRENLMRIPVESLKDLVGDFATQILD